MTKLLGAHAEFDALADRLMGRGMNAVEVGDWPLLVIALEEAVARRATTPPAQGSGDDHGPERILVTEADPDRAVGLIQRVYHRHPSEFSLADAERRGRLQAVDLIVGIHDRRNGQNLQKHGAWDRGYDAALSDACEVIRNRSGAEHSAPLTALSAERLAEIEAKAQEALARPLPMRYGRPFPMPARVHEFSASDLLALVAEIRSLARRLGDAEHKLRGLQMRASLKAEAKAGDEYDAARAAMLGHNTREEGFDNG